MNRIPEGFLDRLENARKTAATARIRWHEDLPNSDHQLDDAIVELQDVARLAYRILQDRSTS